MGLWYEEVFQDRTKLGLKCTRTLYSGQSEFQKVEIFETEQFGRTLAIDGVFMTSEGDEFLYHEMLVHPALTCLPSPKRVLVLGGGDGGTVREVLRHPSIEKVVMVEIDRMVVEASKEHLPSIGTAWDDPRLEVRFENAIEFVKNSDEPAFDAVLLDGTDPVGPGAGLFDVTFYGNCKRMLRDGGVFALQSESPILFRDVFFGLQDDLGSLFRNVHPYFGPVPIYASGIWSWTWASDAGDPRKPDEQRVRQLEKHTRYYNRDIHLGSFAVPNYLRRNSGG